MRDAIGALVTRPLGVRRSPAQGKTSVTLLVRRLGSRFGAKEKNNGPGRPFYTAHLFSCHPRPILPRQH